MIPRIIHQIWLSPPLPDRYRLWRERLMELHPGWDVQLWTPDNLPDYDRVMDTYDLRGYHPTIASDVFRVLMVLKYGGFYLDCDCEPVGCLEPLLGHQFVCCGDGGSNNEFAGYPLKINTGDGFGAVAGSSVLAEFVERCDRMRGRPESILYRYGFLGLSEHLDRCRGQLMLLSRREWEERYVRHQWHMDWMTAKSITKYRPVISPRPLQEPFKKDTPPARKHSWPTAEEMLRHNRGSNVGCCGRPSNHEIKR